jgi:hypothetical protein
MAIVRFIQLLGRRQGRFAHSPEEHLSQYQFCSPETWITNDFNQIAWLHIRFSHGQQSEARTFCLQKKLSRTRMNNLPAHFHRTECRGLRIKQQ